VPKPIKVRGRFATAYDTAETLGVSPSRTQELIEAVKRMTQGVVYRSSNKDGSFVARKKMKTGSPATAVRMKKNSGRHAEATKKKAQTRVAKAHR
jgi:hypothetical protein